MPVLGLAQTWSGYLVDAKCYQAEENNVNPFDPNFDANHNRGVEVEMCRPNAKTKSFAVVQTDGRSFRLDAAGNAKALDLVKSAVAKSGLRVSVSGPMHKDTVTVDSISPVK